jgi:hypothetical protein
MTDFPGFAASGENRIVYVRPVAKDSLPQDVQDQIDGAGPVYAIHGADGAVLALAADRNLAFGLARMNNMAPVSVH